MGRGRGEHRGLGAGPGAGPGRLGGNVPRGKGMGVRRAKWIKKIFTEKKTNPTPLIFLSKHFQQGHECTGSIDFLAPNHISGSL